MSFAIYIFSTFSAMIPLAIVLLKGGRPSKDIKLLIGFELFALACDGVGYLLAMRSINNHAVGNVYLIVQFVVMYHLISTEVKDKPFVKQSFVFLILVYLINFSFIQGPSMLNFYSNALGSLALIGLALYYLYSLLMELPTLHIYKLPKLWIAFAVIVYYSCTFFVFLFYNFFSKEHIELTIAIWAFHNFINFSKNILLGIAVWQSLRKTTLSSL